MPIYPPTGIGKLTGYLDNTLHIVARSGAKLLLTSGDIKKVLGTIQARAPELEKVIAVEGVRRMREELRPAKVGLDDTCFLQFTSGSTSRPKGVVLTHRNLAANVRAIMQLGLGLRDSVDSGASWLPLYHDMGLIGFVIAPLYHVNTITFLPPLLFLKRPVRWLETISRHRASVSFGPNFAYALCVKRIKESETAGARSLELARRRLRGRADPRGRTCAPSPIGSSPSGSARRPFVCCYGMAESTLAISFSKLGAGVSADVVDGDALWSKGRAEPAPPGAENATPIVGCGEAFEGHAIEVFALDDEASERPLGDREVGELRLRGPSLMAGYYNEPELTREAFAGGWLKTGDIGYLADGKVHVCGRSKELIIVNGRNYYPQDLEWEAGKVEGVRKGNVVAFGTMKPTNDRERVIICFETSVTAEDAKQAQKGEVRRVVQQALGLTVDDVVSLGAGVLPKTSSGKLQRSKTRELYETGALLGRTAAREGDALGVAKELAKSQIGYFRHAILGARKDDERG